MNKTFLLCFLLTVLLASTAAPVQAEPLRPKIGLAGGIHPMYALEVDVPIPGVPATFQGMLGTPPILGFPYRSIVLVRVEPEVVPGHRLGVAIGNIDQITQQFQVIGPTWQADWKGGWFRLTPMVPIQWLGVRTLESLEYWLFFPAIPWAEVGYNATPNLELSLRFSFAPLKASLTF